MEGRPVESLYTTTLLAYLLRLVRRPLIERQRNLEGSSSAGRTVDVNLPIVCDHKLLDEVEPNPQPADALRVDIRRPVKTIENQRKSLLGDADTFVRHADVGGRVFPNGDLDSSTPGTVLEGIADQMADNLVKPSRIAPHFDRPVMTFDDDQVAEPIGL